MKNIIWFLAIIICQFFCKKIYAQSNIFYAHIGKNGGTDHQAPES